jgi:rhamnosyltransferase
VLLATYNGVQYVEAQLESLTANVTPFTAHWLDDHSTDGTRDVVRAAAARGGIDLMEWHQPQRAGIPGAFFQLLETVDADIYLFCDQDDIWQPGKIDSTVEHLLPDLASPALCFSDPLIFEGNRSEFLERHAAVRGISNAAVPESSLFMYNPACGHTMGFTRPLREIFVRHQGVAREYALMHDWWMYLIARGSGTARMLHNVPTTLYRQHGNNAVGVLRRRLDLGYGAAMWRRCQAARRLASRQAQGFLQAYPTLSPGPARDRVAGIARLVSALGRRQSPAALVRLLRSRAFATWEHALWMAATCLCGDARVDPRWRRRWDPPATESEQ